MDNSAIIITKAIVGNVARIGVASLSATITKKIIEERNTSNKFEKASMIIGGGILGSMAGDLAYKGAEKMIDGISETVTAFSELRDTIKEMKESTTVDGAEVDL